MFRHFLMLRLTVKDGERAFLMRAGRFERVLGPGRHRLFDPLLGLAVELHQAVRTDYPADRFAVLTAALWGASALIAVWPFSFVMLIFLTGFEILVSFLQAYIFTILTAVYIGGAMHPEH